MYKMYKGFGNTGEIGGSEARKYIKALIFVQLSILGILIAILGLLINM